MGVVVGGDLVRRGKDAVESCRVVAHPKVSYGRKDREHPCAPVSSTVVRVSSAVPRGPANSTTRIAALAAATLALPGTATAAADWPGVWRATWPNDHKTELTIVRIDDDGNAHGAYCHLTPQGRTSYIDLHPEAVRAELDNTDDDVLRIERARRRWEFRLGDSVVNMQFQFGDREPRELDLVRVAEQTCAARIQQRTPPRAWPWPRPSPPLCPMSPTTGQSVCGPSPTTISASTSPSSTSRTATPGACTATCATEPPSGSTTSTPNTGSAQR